MEKIDEQTAANDFCEVQRKRVGRSRKTKSMYGENPFCRFGPKAQLCQGTTLTIPDPSSQKLTWIKSPLTVLIIKKLHDPHVVSPFKAVVKHLIEDRQMVVLVEDSLLDDDYLQADAEFEQVIRSRLQTFKSGTCDNLGERVDFIITLGGDGTLIHASSLFQQSIPPVLAFNLGSLGFLTPFTPETYKESISHVINGNAGLTLRSRLKCIVCRKGSGWDLTHVKDLENSLITRNAGANKHATYNVLNEVVIDRGPSPYLCNVDLYVERKLVTSVQGDGVIISTPTGSTAYATAAGASMIHPCVPAILITPICPHSLSFRPIVLPAGVEVAVTLSPDSRNAAWASFDGRNRVEINHGDSVRITTSIYPLPSVCADDQLSDWFSSLAECLHWNVRRPQRPLSSNRSSGMSSAASLFGDLSLSEDVSE